MEQEERVPLVAYLSLVGMVLLAVLVLSTLPAVVAVVHTTARLLLAQDKMAVVAAVLVETQEGLLGLA